jgi:hypothetical protein
MRECKTHTQRAPRLQWTLLLLLLPLLLPRMAMPSRGLVACGQETARGGAGDQGMGGGGLDLAPLACSLSAPSRPGLSVATPSASC